MATELEFNFKSVLTDCDIWGFVNALKAPTHVDIDFGKPSFTVEWDLQPDAREYGMKEISVFIKKVTGAIEWTAETEYLAEDEKQALIDAGGKQYVYSIDGVVEVDSSAELLGRKWTVISKVKFGESGSCCPENCEIDFQEMTITIS
jgi:hypothetical protein